MGLVAETAFGADAEAVANDQHADHQLGIDAGAAHRSVERSQLLAQSGQVDKRSIKRSRWSAGTWHSRENS